MQVIEQMPVMCLAERVLVSVLHACSLLIAQPSAALLRSVFPIAASRAWFKKIIPYSIRVMDSSLCSFPFSHAKIGSTKSSGEWLIRRSQIVGLTHLINHSLSLLLSERLKEDRLMLRTSTVA